MLDTLATFMPPRRSAATPRSTASDDGSGSNQRLTPAAKSTTNRPETAKAFKNRASSMASKLEIKELRRLRQSQNADPGQSAQDDPVRQRRPPGRDLRF